jgi:hypothetical protein
MFRYSHTQMLYQTASSYTKTYKWVGRYLVLRSPFNLLAKLVSIMQLVWRCYDLHNSHGAFARIWLMAFNEGNNSYHSNQGRLEIPDPNILAHRTHVFTQGSATTQVVSHCSGLGVLSVLSVEFVVDKVAVKWVFFCLSSLVFLSISFSSSSIFIHLRQWQWACYWPQFL